MNGNEWIILLVVGAYMYQQHKKKTQCRPTSNKNIQSRTLWKLCECEWLIKLFRIKEKQTRLDCLEK